MERGSRERTVKVPRWTKFKANQICPFKCFEKQRKRKHDTIRMAVKEQLYNPSLNYGYANSNYQTKDKQSKSEEVLITNY